MHVIPFGWITTQGDLNSPSTLLFKDTVDIKGTFVDGPGKQTAIFIIGS